MQISAVLSLGPLLQMGVPTLWAVRADRSGRPVGVLRLLCVGSLLFALPLLVARSLISVLLVYTVHQVFAAAVAGMAEALALGRPGRGGRPYGQIRLWGSLSFGLTSLGLGALLSFRGQRPGDLLVPAAMCVGFALTLFASLMLDEDRELARPRRDRARGSLATPSFLLILALAFLHWLSSAPYRGFFAIMARSRGLSDATVGELFLLAVAAEVAAFRLFARLRERFPLHRLLAVSFASGAVRSLATAWIASPLGLAGLQLLHALTFGVFWAASLEWLSLCTPPARRNTSQSLYGAATFGLGTVLGTLGTGVLFDRRHDAAPAFVAAGLLEFLPLALVLAVGRRIDPTAPA